MKRLPLFLACGNAIISTICFAAAILNPLRAGLLPLIVFFLDYPASLVIQRIGDTIATHIEARMLAYYFVYLLLGALWYYVGGIVIRFLIDRL